MASIMGKYEIIDQKDRAILRVLQDEGRIAIVDLAERVNLSKSPCLQRLRRLEKTGFIRGYRADLDPHRINQGHIVYVQVKLEKTKSGDLERFNKAVMQIPHILTCHMMTGGYDYLLKIRARDMTAFRELMGDVIANLPGVLQTSSYPVMEEVKDTSRLIVEEPDNG